MGGLPNPPPPGRIPPDADPPGCRTPLGADLPPMQTEGMTHACENITMPQTSFVDGN